MHVARPSDTLLVVLDAARYLPDNAALTQAPAPRRAPGAARPARLETRGCWRGSSPHGKCSLSFKCFTLALSLSTTLHTLSRSWARGRAGDAIDRRRHGQAGAAPPPPPPRARRTRGRDAGEHARGGAQVSRASTAMDVCHPDSGTHSPSFLLSALLVVYVLPPRAWSPPPPPPRKWEARTWAARHE